jgi:uncharacterized protein YdiU (UPF0061 family)
MTEHHTLILDCKNHLALVLSKIWADLTKAIQTISTKEKTLSARFQTFISDYAQRASKFTVVEARHASRKVEVDVVRRLGPVKEDLNEKQKEVSDHSPLGKIRTVITKMRKQTQAFELRSSIFQRSLTQM